MSHYSQGIQMWVNLSDFLSRFILFAHYVKEADIEIPSWYLGYIDLSNSQLVLFTRLK